MVQIIDQRGTIFLYGDKFDMKIDTNRRLYIKPKDKETYQFIEDIPADVKYSEDKQVYIKSWYDVIEEELRIEE